MFHNREDGARQLAELMKGRRFHDPLVLAIPRGGVVTGATLARELGAELDIVLARKLRSPDRPELALGAVLEDGRTYLNENGRVCLSRNRNYLSDERAFQIAAIDQRKEMFRNVRPPAPIAGRSVIVADDGVATGATMLAALHAVRPQKPLELIVAVPVGAPPTLEELRPWCDNIFCVLHPPLFWAVGHFYEEFGPVEDSEVVRILGEFAPRPQPTTQTAEAPSRPASVCATVGTR